MPNFARNPSFTPTQWSRVRQAADLQDPSSRQALEQLCVQYWYPIYAFLRRSGHSAEDAEDLTQGFFATLVEGNLLAMADPEKGRLRTYLLSCVKHHEVNDHVRKNALKRGGGKVILRSTVSAEELYAAEPQDTLSPDRLYQRRWALGILEATMDQLAEEHRQDGKEHLLEVLAPYLGFSTEEAEAYDVAAQRLGVSLANVKVLISRLRKRWREILRHRVSATLEDPTPENIKAELAELVTVL